MAEIERWEPDDITEIESFLLDVSGHGDRKTGGISRDLPGGAELGGGEDLLAGPPSLVVLLVSVVITTQTSGTSCQNSGNLNQGGSTSELRAVQRFVSYIYPDVEVSSLVPANFYIVLHICHCSGDFIITQNHQP